MPHPKTHPIYGIYAPADNKIVNIGRFMFVNTVMLCERIFPDMRINVICGDRRIRGMNSLVYYYPSASIRADDGEPQDVENLILFNCGPIFSRTATTAIKYPTGLLVYWGYVFRAVRMVYQEHCLEESEIVRENGGEDIREAYEQDLLFITKYACDMIMAYYDEGRFSIDAIAVTLTSGASYFSQEAIRDGIHAGRMAELEMKAVLN